MINEIEKKGKNWFKSVLSNQNQLEKSTTDKHEPITEDALAQSSKATVEIEPTLTDSNKTFFSKDNQDKIVLDVMVSIESIIKERQLLLYKNKGLEEQLSASNDTISRLKHDQIKKDQLFQEKMKEIRELENNLTNKQMNYDQLLEDYKEYQLTSNMEYEKISNQLETETAKYNKLYDESTNTQYQNMLKINALDDKIRSLEIENQKYQEQYQKIVNEKAVLMKTINDFTEKMSFSFTAKTIGNNATDSE